MLKGLVYIAVPDDTRPAGQRVERRLVPLERLNPALNGCLSLAGEHVQVKNAGEVQVPGTNGDSVLLALGSLRACPGDELVFDPCRGGERLYKVEVASEAAREAYVSAARFGEVNTYFHVDRIAAYIAGLLREIGAPPLPRVVAAVIAHGVGEIDPVTGLRDGVGSGSFWKPFEGGHYRLPSDHEDVHGCRAQCPTGEIHLGPGWRRTRDSELARCVGGTYLFNASHDAGIIYHEFGHHVTRHTADFRANRLRDPARQDNRKCAMDEGTCDYWAATMLGTPHIWVWHEGPDEAGVYRRSLTAPRTMAQFNPNPYASPHENGNIWAIALWDLRTALGGGRTDGARIADLLLLKALHLMGSHLTAPSVSTLCALREPFEVGAAALLRADEELFGAAHREAISAALARRGIQPARWQDLVDRTSPSGPHVPTAAERPEPLGAPWSRHVAREDVPRDDDILSAAELQRELDSAPGYTPTVLAAGDVMLGGRAHGPLMQFGDDYPFAAVRPLLARAPIVLANLEGPLSRVTKRERRNWSYRTDTRFAAVLRRAGLNVLTLANNHLTDCRRHGVVETLEALRAAGIAPIGAGLNQRAAHAPAILTANGLQIGLLGYYWNTRTSATETLPGSALDPPEMLEEDIRALRRRVDRVVVTFHWGIPYVRDVAPEDRLKAQRAVDLGADAVIGHHPHVIQRFEVYKSRPIFYSVGNFAFGSGNSQAECILIGLTFEPRAIQVRAYPAYVKNRDPRVNYQPKVLRGQAADHVLRRLVTLSGESGELLRVDEGRGRCDLPWSGETGTATVVATGERKLRD